MTNAISILDKRNLTDTKVMRVEARLGENSERKPVPGRSCGSCTMCCKLYAVPVMQKPEQTWCRECMPGKGCKIWETRPQFCRDFHCHYILDPNIGDDWKPDVCKFIMNFQTANTLWIMVDAKDRLAWKREPYYSTIKRWSADFIAAGGYIRVGDSIDQYCITPDADVRVGRYGEDVNFRVQRLKSGQITIYEVVVVPPAEKVNGGLSPAA